MQKSTQIHFVAQKINVELMESLAKSQLDQMFRQPMAAFLSEFT